MPNRVDSRWRKVLGDVLGNLGRSVLVTVSIALGAASVGTMLGAREAVVTTITMGYYSVSPASASLFAAPLDADLRVAARRVPGVSDAQVRGVLIVRMQLQPDEWTDLRLYVLPDDAPQRINIVRPEVGAWPAPPGELLLERSSLSYVHRQVGDTLLIETPNAERAELRIAGTAYDLNQPPVTGTGQVLGYISPATLAVLGRASEARLDQLDITIDGATDEGQMRSVAASVRRVVEQGGGHVLDTFVPPPGKHPAHDGSETMLVLLALIGGVMVFMAALLVANTISAPAGESNPANRGHEDAGRHARADYSDVCGDGVGLRLDRPGARHSRRGPRHLGVGDIRAGVGQLRSAGTRPFTGRTGADGGRGARRTSRGSSVADPNRNAHERARSNRQFWRRWRGFRQGVDRSRTGASPRSATTGVLSVRNTFRRKARLWLTLATLVLAGSVFIGVLSVREALLRSVDDEFRYMAYDAQVTLAGPVAADTLERTARGVAGVLVAEAWGGRSAYRLRGDGTESAVISLIGPPADTRMIQPLLLDGRWIGSGSGDVGEAVISSDLVESEPDVRVGGDLVLKVDGRPTTWRIVGLVQTYRFDRQVGPSVFVERGALGQATGVQANADTLQIATERHDRSGQAQVATRLGVALEAAGLPPRSVTTGSARRALREDVASIILTFLVVMAVLLAVVGGLGLAGTMTRERGDVARARACPSPRRRPRHVELSQGERQVRAQET